MIDNFFYTVRLAAGVPFTAPYGGTFFALWDTGAVRSVSLQFVAQGQTGQKIIGMTSGFQVEANFDQVIFAADADTTVQFFASAKPLKLGTKDGQQVGVKALEPLPVVVDGTFTPVLGDVKITNTDADPLPVAIKTLTQINNYPAQTVGKTKTLIATEKTVKKLMIRNGSVGALVFIGGANVTAENAVIRLSPGDVWIEDDAAAADWYVISTEENTTLQIQGVK